jgi:hypothetical protein
VKVQDNPLFSLNRAALAARMKVGASARFMLDFQRRPEVNLELQAGLRW